ncbi:putative choline transporter, neither null mutation nor overexpression affects choline transport [Actinomortierella wolfii]|nr:putative choline transporter, neither null mutation nor overexpression affects choline transport [Actinomortierella wolfii]
MTNPEDRREETQPLLASTSSSASAAAVNKRRTVQTAKHHDLWATILFFVNLVIFGVFYYHVHRLANGNFDGTVRGTYTYDEKDMGFAGIESMGLGKNIFTLHTITKKGWLDEHAFGILVVTAALVSALFTTGTILLLKLRPAVFIKVSALFVTLATLAGGIVSFVVQPRDILWGIIAVAIVLAVVVKNKYIRSKVPLNRWLIIETIVNTKRYWGVIPVAIFSIAIISSVGFFLDKAVYMFYAVYTDKGDCGYNDEGHVKCKSYEVIPAAAYCLFTLTWVLTALTNLVYVILARVLGSAYYIQSSQRDASSSTTLKAIKYATVHSFGTISLASLVLTLLVGFYPLFLNLKKFEFAQKGLWVIWILEHSSIVLGTLFRIITYLILVHVALFNRSFKEGVQASRNLLQDRLWSAVVSYGLIVSTLSVLAGLIVLLTIGYAMAYVFIFKPSFYKDHQDDENARNQVLASVVAVVTIISALIASIPQSIFLSGAVSTYVALGENPETLARNKPQLYADIRAECPEVGRDVHGGTVAQ